MTEDKQDVCRDVVFENMLSQRIRMLQDTVSQMLLELDELARSVQSMQHRQSDESESATQTADEERYVF